MKREHTGGDGGRALTALRERWARVLLVIGSILLTTGAAECVARVSGVAPLISSAAGGFKRDHPLLRILRPSQCKSFGALEAAYFVSVCTNKMGLRDRDHAPNESPRVLVVGDSFTFGWGVEAPDTFTSHLERALRIALPSRRPGVWNAGLSFTSQAHQDVLLRYIYPETRPDLVVLAFAEDNDIDENIIWNPNLGVFPEQGEIPTESLRAYRDQIRNVVFEDFLFRHSALVRFFRQRHLRASLAAEAAALDEQLKAHGLSGAPITRMVADEGRRRFLQAFSHQYDDDWRVTEILLERIRRFVTERGAKLMLVRVPSKNSLDDGAWARVVGDFCGNDLATVERACGALDRTHTAKRLEAYAAAHQLSYLDPGPELRAGIDRKESIYIPGDIHFSRLGHARVGEILAREIAPRFGGTPVPPLAADAARKPRRVGAYWYPWYRSRDWRSFTDYTPQGGPYLSTDTAAIAQQLHWADRGEIDFFMVELLAEHNPEAKFNNQAVDSLVNAIVERRRRGFTDLKFAILSDVYIGETQVGTKERWLELSRKHLDHIWSRYVEPHRDAYELVDGRPLVGIFSPPTSIDDARFTIVRPYWVSHGQWQNWDRKNELTPFWDIYPQTVTDRRFLSVTPGYNDWRLERNPQVGPYVPRLDGRTLIQQWRRAFEVNPDIVLVYSYNEYFEQTQIEPTLEQGDRYLVLNALMARRFKDGRPVTDIEAQRLPEVLEPTPKAGEERVAWLSVEDARMKRRGLNPVNEGGAELGKGAEIEFDVDVPEAFVLGLSHRPSFDRCAGLSVTVTGEGPPKTETFATELTQLSILRGTPMSKNARHVKLAVDRVPAAPDCGDSGTRPIVLLGVTRYPLPTTERKNYAVDNPDLLLEGFWEIEKTPQGPFVWSRGRSSVTISGLPAGARYRVTLTFRDTANFGNIDLGSDPKHLQRALLTPGHTAAFADPLTVSSEGKLKISFETPVWQPSVLFHSEDKRALGVALRLLTLDKVEGGALSPHEQR